MTRTVASPTFVTAHALERFVEARAIDRRGAFPKLIDAVKRSIDLAAEIVVALTGRKLVIEGRRPTHLSKYLLCPERIGLFVIESDSVVTYLRLGDQQRSWCLANYPVALCES